MASSTASVVQKPPPPPSRIITLEGHISGEKGLIRLEIDWLKGVIDLKKAIRKEKEPALNHLAPYNLDVYKLDIVNKADNGYAGLKSRWTLDQYLTGAWSCLELEDTEDLHNLWSDGKGTPTNEADKIHFLVVLPEKNEPPAKWRKTVYSKSILLMDIDDLVLTLQQWIEKQATLKPLVVNESLEAFGNSFPLQQCDGIFSSIRDQMLVSFQVKMAGPTLDWKKYINIPIIGAASGTGKSSICSRMLQHLAHQAQKHRSPPLSAHADSDAPTQDPYDSSSLRTVISDPNETPGNYLPTDAKVDRLFWTPGRLEDFQAQLIRSNECRLTLTIDFMVEMFSEHMNVELRLAALILVTYQKVHHRDGPMWKTEDELISFLEGESLPLGVALEILHRVENNNIIVIHLDETQAVSRDILRVVVRRLVACMGPDQEGKFLFIFPILSGLSLESLLTSTELVGAGIIRYTPPVLMVDSMLTIIDAMLSNSGDSATKPSKLPGLRRLLHDIRGPTRYFQAALFIIQQYSSHNQTISDSFHLGSIVNRKAMRAGLEKVDQNWPAVFEAVARLTQTTDFIRDLSILRKNNQLMVELFPLDVLGIEIFYYQKFMVSGEERPLSYLIQQGWLTICDFADGCSDEVSCRIFLPFLAVHNACCESQKLILAGHPGMVPLCKKSHWTQNEQYDAKTLQYKLSIPWVEGNSSPPKCKLSTIFGNLGAVADVSFVIPAAPQYTQITSNVENFEHLNELILSSGSCPTVYLNTEKAEFADSFVFLSLEQPSEHEYHILCIQSKLFKTSALSIDQVQEEYEKVRLVCGSHPFTLVIAVDQLTKTCLTQLANHADDDLKSHVLVLDQEGFETFYGKPFAHRRRLLTGKDLPLFCDA